MACSIFGRRSKRPTGQINAARVSCADRNIQCAQPEVSVPDSAYHNLLSFCTETRCYPLPAIAFQYLFIKPSETHSLNDNKNSLAIEQIISHLSYNILLDCVTSVLTYSNISIPNAKTRQRTTERIMLECSIGESVVAR